MLTRFQQAQWMTAAFALFAIMNGPTHADVDAHPSTCTDMSRPCLIEIARTYLDARYDGRMRPYQRVALNVQRWENGVKTADSFDDILGPSNGEVSRTIFPRNLDRAFVDGDEALFFWILDMKDKPDQPLSKTVHLAERFKFNDDQGVCGDILAPCITEIEVIFCISPHPSESATPEGASDPDWFSKFRCNRDG